MPQKEFKAESKRLLELMIHSIYSNKEIFLRELISNASDATDKRYFQEISSGGEALNREDLPIEISINKDKRQLIIKDHGIGMTEEELENNLGTIAQSGSLEFKENMVETKGTEDVDIIGQFGVGFYSAFMVADKISVVSHSLSGEVNQWESIGIEGYTITPGKKKNLGTTVTLTLKENTADDEFDEYLDAYHVEQLIKKHSDYIRYPIRMEKEKTRPIEDKEGEFETYFEVETINSMTPLWRRRKSEVTPEEYNAFYKEKFSDFQDPARVMYTSTEGAATYNALMFIPAHMPMNYHSKDYKKGLELYASGVLIMEYAGDLLPDYFGFVRGVVDSQDLSLNISREMLQQNRQVVVIANRLEKKIQSELLAMQKNSREDYNKFFENFGRSLKYGVYENFGNKNELLQDLLMFHSSTGEWTTLEEYLHRMKEDQEYIYFASGENLAQLKNLPAAEGILEKGYEVLYFTDQVDEFVTHSLMKYGEKEFRSITGGEDLGIETDEEKEAMEEKETSNKELLDFMKESLEGKVEAVRLSQRLKSHSACLTTQGEITLEMEKTFANMPGGPDIKAERVLEINPDHPLFAKVTELYTTDKDKLKSYTEILYNQSLLLEGMPLEDPAAYTKAVTDLLV